MAHPDVLIEEDYEQNLRWITVNGRHLPFYGATQPLSTEDDGFNEEASPEHPRWLDFLAAPEGYADFKQRVRQ